MIKVFLSIILASLTASATYYPNNPNGGAASSASAPTVLANDQAQIPVTNTPAVVTATPTANSMAALNATVQYSVQAGGAYYLTLTNGPAATTVWSGTVTFQYSTNGGGAWSSFTVSPVNSPANSANVTTSTANGMWLAEIPAGVGSQSVLIRSNMTSYTSGTAYFLVSAAIPNASISIPWTYSVTTANTVVGPLDASGINEIDLQMSAITTAVYTWQGTNDPTLATWNPIDVQDTGTQGIGAATIAAAPTGVWRVNPSGYRWVRLQCTTTGTVWTVQGLIAKLGQPISINGYGNGVAVSSLPTLAAVTTVTTVTTVSTVTTLANGQTASGSAATGSPLRIGGTVLTTLPTTLATGNAANLNATTAGVLETKEFGTAENDWQATSGSTPLATTTSTALKAAGAASIRNYATSCQFMNTSATVSTAVYVEDGSTIIWAGFLPASTSALVQVPLNVEFHTPLRGSAATAMNIVLGTTAASVYYNCQGFQSF